MAIFHFSVNMIKRSLGHSAVAASAYRTGKKLEDERTGEVHDYTRKKVLRVRQSLPQPIPLIGQ